MFWIENAYAKIWKIDSKENYDDLRISTSEKDSREEGKYINSNWFARAIGHAHQQIANNEIQEGDRVKIVKGKVSNESYEDKDGNKKSALRVVILEFEATNGNSAPAKPAAKETKSKKPAAKTKAANEVIDDSELPF